MLVIIIWVVLLIRHVLSDNTPLRVVMEQNVIKFMSDGWIQERGVNSADYIDCTFVMKLDPNKMSAFETQIYDISTPTSANYGNYLTNNNIANLISPSVQNVQIVLDFLAKYGVTNTDNTNGNSVTVNNLRTMVTVRMTGDVADTLFQTQFVLHRSVTERDVTLFRIARPYSQPPDVAAVVAYVDDILRFPSVSTPLLTYGQADSGIPDSALLDPLTQIYTSTNPYLSCGNDCYGYTTPAVLQALYNYPQSLIATPAYTGTCIVAFQQKYYNVQNVGTFESQCFINDPSSGAATMVNVADETALCSK